MVDYGKLLRYALGSDAKIDSSVADGVTTIRVSEIAGADRMHAVQVLRSMGMVPTINNRELASLEVAEYTDDPAVIEQMDKDAVFDAADENVDDEDDAGELAAFMNDGNMDRDSKLVVLRDPDILKMADKLFTQVLGNEEDYADYAKFLYNFDTFLMGYKPVGGQFNPNAYSDNLDNPMDTEIAKVVVSLGDKLKSRFHDRRALFLNGFREYLAKELAEKSTRSEFLSILMSAMSSSNGTKLVDAWGSGDGDAFSDAYEAIGMSLLDKMPDGEEDEGGSDEEEVDGAAGSSREGELPDIASTKSEIPAPVTT